MNILESIPTDQSDLSSHDVSELEASSSDNDEMTFSYDDDEAASSSDDGDTSEDANSVSEVDKPDDKELSVEDERREQVKYECHDCKRYEVFSYKKPVRHDPLTGAVLCGRCNQQGTKLRTEELSEDSEEETDDQDTNYLGGISSRPLTSLGIQAYAFCQVQTFANSPIPIPTESNDFCSGSCPCHRRYDDDSVYPTCDKCNEETYTAEFYAPEWREMAYRTEYCGNWYCVYCDKFLCEEHIDCRASHPGKWIVDTMEGHEFQQGRHPVYEHCVLCNSIYAFVDMTELRVICLKCSLVRPSQEYLHHSKAGPIIRERLISALTSELVPKGALEAAPNSLSADNPSTLVATNSSSPVTATASTPIASGMSLPAIVNLFLATADPFLDVLMELDVLSKLLLLRKSGKGYQFWGILSNARSHVYTYAKSRFSMAMTLQHCIDSLQLTSVMKDVSNPTNAGEGQGGEVEARANMSGEETKEPRTQTERKLREEVAKVLNADAMTRTRVSEELTYLRTIECLRETIEYGHLFFFTDTRTKAVDMLSQQALELKALLHEMKEKVIAINKVYNEKVQG